VSRTYDEMKQNQIISIFEDYNISKMGNSRLLISVMGRVKEWCGE